MGQCGARGRVVRERLHLQGSAGSLGDGGATLPGKIQVSGVGLLLEMRRQVSRRLPATARMNTTGHSMDIQVVGVLS